MDDADTKMQIKVMMLQTLISIMRSEESENRDRLKAVELLDKIGETQWMKPNAMRQKSSG